MKDSRKDFIKNLHSEVSSGFKTVIEKEFPKLFKKDDLEVGKWYTDDLDQGFLVFITKIKGDKYYGFGFNGSGKWSEGGNGSWGSISNDIDRLATDKEVEKAHIKEAKKRGLKPLNHRCIRDGLIWNDNIGGKYEFEANENTLYIGASCAFQDGKWSEIVEETITKEQAQEATRILVEYNNQ
jgi:hypothetical protein